jgi:hypothetical protein
MVYAICGWIDWRLNPEILNYLVSRKKVTHAKGGKAFRLDNRSCANFAPGTLFACVTDPRPTVRPWGDGRITGGRTE